MPERSEKGLRQELLDLRKGPGLTRARLASSPHIMEALGTSDPAVAAERFVTALRALGDGLKARALRAAYGVDKPTRPTNMAFVKYRREAFAGEVGRSEKTLELTDEKDAVDDLVLRLAAVHTGPYWVMVLATVQDRRTQRLTVARFSEDLNKREFWPGKPLERLERYNNSSNDSRPALLYSLPPTWFPTAVRLDVRFLSPPMPQRATYSLAPDLLSLTLSAGEAKLSTSLIETPLLEPRPAPYVYGLFWEY